MESSFDSSFFFLFMSAFRVAKRQLYIIIISTLKFRPFFIGLYGFMSDIIVSCNAYYNLRNIQLLKLFYFHYAQKIN